MGNPMSGIWNAGNAVRCHVAVGEEIGLSLGSNLSDRLENLKAARGLISEVATVKLVAAARVFETDPVGVEDVYADMPFLNTVVIMQVTSALDLYAFVSRMHEIEAVLGREVVHGNNEPRTIDVDVLFAGNVVLDTEQLTVPHARWAERRFVVEPFCDVRPDMVLPGESLSVREVLLGLPEEPRVVALESDARWVVVDSEE